MGNFILGCLMLTLAVLVYNADSIPGAWDRYWGRLTVALRYRLQALTFVLACVIIYWALVNYA